MEGLGRNTPGVNQEDAETRQFPQHSRAQPSVPARGSVGLRIPCLMMGHAFLQDPGRGSPKQEGGAAGRLKQNKRSSTWEIRDLCPAGGGRDRTIGSPVQTRKRTSRGLWTHRPRPDGLARVATEIGVLLFISVSLGNWSNKCPCLGEWGREGAPTPLSKSCPTRGNKVKMCTL